MRTAVAVSADPSGRGYAGCRMASSCDGPALGCLRLEPEPDGRERRLVQAMSHRGLASGVRLTLMGHFADAEDKGLLL